MNKRELLRAVYESIDWARLYELAPDAKREEVDEFFRSLANAVESQAAAGHVPGETPEHLVLSCDGSSLGNPGPAGIGIVLTDEAGREVFSRGEGIGRATNNVAEYRALIAGLRDALALGAKKLRIRSDSQLMVRQVTGAYKVKDSALVELHGEACSLLAQLDEWIIEDVPREKNRRADELALAEAKKQKKNRKKPKP